MYWGLVLKTNKRYSQQITKGFHVSNATLDLSTIEKDAVVSIWVHTDDSDHLLCNLSKQFPQVALDLVFSEGETVAFYSKGNGIVHLNGNIMQDDDFGVGDMGDDEELDEEAEDDEIDYAKLKKALNKEKSAKGGKKSNELEKEDSEEDSDDDEDDELGVEEDSDDDDDLNDEDEDMSDDGGDDDDDDDEDEEEEDEEISAPPSKKGKMEKETKQNGVATNGKQAQKQNDQQKKQKGAPQQQPKKEKKDQQQQKPGKKTLASGVIIEDLSPGKGPEATAGKRVTVYYIGRLQKTNKVFDSSQTGDGFKFHLGKNEVIRGWDIGVVGMRVGGKRRIICPPHAAYGPKGAPPAIPGNATLVFEVTLRAIN